MSDSENKYSAIKKVLNPEFQDFGDTLFSEGKTIADWPDFRFTSDNRVSASSKMAGLSSSD